MTNTEPRYYVHTVTSGVGNKVRNPHLVIDRETNRTLDEYASKRAAQMDARDRNTKWKATTMSETVTHHPSCPARQAECEAHATGQACMFPEAHRACLCGPEAAAEDLVIMSERTPDTMLLDIVAHADQAWNDFHTNIHTRRAPKGLLAAVVLDNDDHGTDDIAGSWGVKA